MLGVAWDGTGYGSDGTIWGGEFLVCTADSFERFARLRPFRLPGGEAAIHEPWRTAVSICRQLNEPHDLSCLPGLRIDPRHVESIQQIIDRSQYSPLTSSAGRLFDAAAALIMGIAQAEFDGQPAMWLEAIADHSAAGSYKFSVREDAMSELDWRPVFSQLLGDLRNGVAPGIMAMRFHRSLARGIVGVCSRQTLPVVLVGGVFQNRLLTELVVEEWADVGLPLGLPGVIPPNDGGLAAGQLAIAAAKGNFLPCA